MNTFRLESSYHKEGLYQSFVRKEISLCSILLTALREGANDQDYQEEMLLNHVMGVVGTFILTYDKEDEVIDVWKQVDYDVESN